MDTIKSEQTMTGGNKCPQCGASLPASAPGGLCPACLLKQGAAEDTVTGGKQPAFTPPPISELAGKFPQLEILEIIGKGGMGAVYKARQKQLDRIVALKILPPGIGHDAAFAERFAREAKALAKLNHPGIVTLYEFGHVDSSASQPLYYFLMEFVDGVNLRQLLQSSRVSPREALAIVPQICDALQFAHDQGIVHRDIKPENILLDRRGRVKVADFGLAKIVGVENEPSSGEKTAGISSTTEAGKVMGTPNYMSPEQIANPGEVDHRADIYALGVVFYQMLTGELPGKKIEPPSKKVQIDVRLDEIILRALEKNPELRYQQVSEVKTCVETIVGGTGVPLTNQGKKQEATFSWIGSLPKLNAPFVVKRGNRRVFNWSVIGINFLWSLCLVTVLLPIMLKGMSFNERMQDFIELLFLGFVAVVFAVQLLRGIISPLNSLPAEPDDATGTTTLQSWPALIGVIIFVLTLVALHVFKPTNSDQIKSDYIGQTSFPKGDSIEITSVVRTKDRLMAKGHYNLVSADSAELALYITTKADIGVLTDSRQEMQISKGRGDFELVHTHLVSGLPHVTMYSTNGHGFAGVYFGTKDEAAEESKLDLNTPLVSVETWSPALAPGEKPDLQKILTDAKDLMEQGKYEEALQRHIWYFNHALEYDQGQTGVRLSFALSQWVELGRRYPKAKQALLEIRDRDTQLLASGQGYANLFMDVNSINNYLGQEDATLALFKTMYETDPKLASECYYYAEDLLLKKGEYELLLKCVGDPQAHFESAHRGFEGLIESQQRMAEMRKKYPVPQLPGGAFHPPDMGQLATNNFVGQVCKLVEILVATGHNTDAEKIQDEAVAVLDDPRLKSAVADAAEKVRNKLGQNGNEPKPAAMAAVQGWLALMDTGEFAQSWETAADSFHEAVTKDAWVKLSEKIRQPLGQLISRKEIFTQTSSALPGMPAGSYFVAQFETSFAALTNAVETVEFMQEKDGQWRAISYLIRPRTAEQTAAVTVAQQWLAGIDAGDYAQSWTDAAEYFQGAITQDNWISALKSVRAPLGEMEIRTVDSAVTETQMPGAPDGRYVVMQFETAFAKKNPATETVTFVLEKDGQWKAGGYYIK